MRLLIASRNRDKIAEIKEILAVLDLDIISASDFPDLPEVIEDQDTIRGNAIKKAQETALFAGCYTLADDTGLFVESLQGKPGVYAARYAGENCTYRDNRLKMLQELENIEDRKAEFRTCAVLVDDKGNLLFTAEGVVTGEITYVEKGENGFGYDSIFFCTEANKTFAELDGEEKHRISHRGRALRKILPFLEKLIDRRSDNG
ncbi:MAG: RdgB/HAM1 family non-canonical purine NTP pyrophosphatase [Candidatus Cloacimonetes bacterium]|nr:RdgB/HAM1 family non-canonical purine NTP pyrophosphatase [Candidatus Cloacimonadota bacterium]